MLNRLVAQIRLYGPGRNPLISQVVAGTVSQHVRVNRKRQRRIYAGTGNQFGYGAAGEWATALGSK